MLQHGDCVEVLARHNIQALLCVLWGWSHLLWDHCASQDWSCSHRLICWGSIWSIWTTVLQHAATWNSADVWEKECSRWGNPLYLFFVVWIKLKGTPFCSSTYGGRSSKCVHVLPPFYSSIPLPKYAQRAFYSNCPSACYLNATLNSTQAGIFTHGSFSHAIWWEFAWSGNRKKPTSFPHLVTRFGQSLIQIVTLWERNRRKMQITAEWIKCPDRLGVAIWKHCHFNCGGAWSMTQVPTRNPIPCPMSFPNRNIECSSVD